MPDSISFEDALVTLQSMFPEWDKDTLETLLISNDYHVERTIETVLTMSGDTNVHAKNNKQQQVSPSEQQTNTSEHGKKSGVLRGIKCELPDDFLRPPSWERRIIADEELAVMLQNELFRKEVREMFGEDFIEKSSSNQPRRSSSAARNTESKNGSAAENSDLGILKSISSMGSAAKKNLSVLAERFTQKNGRQSEVGTTREFAPLMEMSNMEDETEVISFDSHNSRSKHILQDDEEFNSENPLFHKTRSEGANSRNEQ